MTGETSIFTNARNARKSMSLTLFMMFNIKFMDKINLAVIGLAAICIGGIIFLSSMKLPTEFLNNVVLILVGFIVGRNEDKVVGLFKK